MHAIRATYFCYWMLYVYASSNNTTCRYKSISPSTCALIFLFVRMSQWLLPICTPHILIFHVYCHFVSLMLASFIATTIVSHVHTSPSGLLRGFSFIHLLPYYIYSHIHLIYAYYPFMYSTMCMTSSFLCSMLLLYLPKAPHPVWIDILEWIVFFFFEW